MDNGTWVIPVVRFELYVARRYLGAKRRDRFFSIATIISVVGVAVGVAALIIAMAINNGFHEGLRDHLVGASSHINLVESEPEYGIEEYAALMEKLQGVEHIESIAPTLYGEMMITTPLRATGSFLKGVDPEAELRVSGLLSSVVDGSHEALETEEGEFPGILLGRGLADTIGARVSTIVTLMNPQGEVTPLGRIPAFKQFQVVGIFETGFYELDNHWSVCLLRDAQRALSLKDVVNSLEFRLNDLDMAEEAAAAVEHAAGPEFAASTWMERNRSLFTALQVEKLVSTLIISMTMLVAAMNILISLVMMVIEKTKEIAILKSMGTRQAQIRRIFMWQGMIIGAIGTAVGVVLGLVTCLVCDRYRLLPLNAEVYGLAYVPFSPEALDALIVALAAVAISYLITIYPSSSAARVAPAEILRYE